MRLSILSSIPVWTCHGLDLLVHVDTALIARLTADQAAALRPEIGQTIPLIWSAKDTRVFAA